MFPSFIFINAANSSENQKSFSNINGSQQSSINKQMKYDPTLMDSSITKVGREQLQLTKNCINLDHIDIVVVSPLRKALETCEVIFGKKSEIKFFIQPLMSQKIVSSADVGAKIRESKQIYGKAYDFSKIPQQNQQRWYLDYVLSEGKRKQVLSLIQSKKIGIHEATLQAMKQQTLQTDLQLQDRVKKLKQQLIIYKQMSKKKVALVGHPLIFAALTATGFHEDGEPVNGIMLKNSEVKEIPIVIEGYHQEDDYVLPFCRV